MAERIDARGKACPMPVILAKQALDSGARDLTVLVDDETAVENLKRLAGSQGMTARSSPGERGFSVRVTGEGAPAPGPEPDLRSPAVPAGGRTFFIGKDHIGGGDPELGGNLMKMFLYTLAQSGRPPKCLLFMNSGVKLPAGEERQVIDSLKDLEAKGCEILVCGTCLNFFDLTERLKAGTVSNMYDIVEKMQDGDGVITV